MFHAPHWMLVTCANKARRVTGDLGCALLAVVLPGLWDTGRGRVQIVCMATKRQGVAPENQSGGRLTSTFFAKGLNVQEFCRWRRTNK